MNYHTSWNIKTPMPVTLAWKLAQTVAPKLLRAAPRWKPKHKGERTLRLATNALEFHGTGVGSNLIDGVPHHLSWKIRSGRGASHHRHLKKQIVWRGPSPAWNPFFSGNADRHAKCLSVISLRRIHPNPEKRKIWETASGLEIWKEKKEETIGGRKNDLKQITTWMLQGLSLRQNNSNCLTRVNNMKEKRWEVLLSLEIMGEMASYG